MIFITVGTQLAFDRLIRAADEWAESHPTVEIFAQIGPGEYIPHHMQWTRTLDCPAFDVQFRRAEILIGHAGMGTILSCLEHEKKLVVMPRLARYQEHRNDHQMATAKCLAHLKQVKVAYTPRELHDFLDRLVELRPGTRIESVASPELLHRLQDFIDHGILPASIEPADDDALAHPTDDRLSAGTQFERTFGEGTGPIAGVILLGGGATVNEWSYRIRRSLLDLPIDDGRSLLDWWKIGLETVRGRLSQDRLPVYVMLGNGALRPYVGHTDLTLPISVQEDRGAFRGTGGTLRDVAQAFDDEEVLLVANGLQWLPPEFQTWPERLVDALAHCDFALQMNAESQPLDVMAVRARALRAIPEQGFVDLKEQALQMIAQDHRIRAVDGTDWRVRSVRNESSYLAAVASAQGRSDGFGLVEPKADVHPEAVLHNAVVLDEGVVSAGSMVVDAVVCPTEQVAAGQVLRRNPFPRDFPPLSCDEALAGSYHAVGLGERIR